MLQDWGTCFLLGCQPKAALNRKRLPTIWQVYCPPHLQATNAMSNPSHAWKLISSSAPSLEKQQQQQLFLSKCMSMRLPPQHVASLPTLRSQSWMIIHLENPFTAASGLSSNLNNKETESWGSSWKLYLLTEKNSEPKSFIWWTKLRT